MIVFEAVSKRYPGGYEALADINLRIEDGQLVVLTGHSGAGKSTLLKMLPVIERPNSGRITINGQDVAHLPARAIPYLRRKLGLILQDTRLLPERSVFDNVMLPLAIMGHPLKDAQKRVAAALERVGLGARGREKPPGLSGGEQQRVAIARAIVHRPSILIADEPTAHLDPAYARDIADLFLSFNEAGVTVLISTHDHGLFARVPNARQVTLAHGRLIGEAA